MTQIPLYALVFIYSTRSALHSSLGSPVLEGQIAPLPPSSALASRPLQLVGMAAISWMIVGLMACVTAGSDAGVQNVSLAAQLPASAGGSAASKLRGSAPPSDVGMQASGSDAQSVSNLVAPPPENVAGMAKVSGGTSAGECHGWPMCAATGCPCHQNRCCPGLQCKSVHPAFTPACA